MSDLRSATARFGITLMLLLPSIAVLPESGTGQAAAVHMTSEQDRQQMMDQLHITSLRAGVSGDPKAANAANYDESKADTGAKLPDALVMNDGKPVTSAKMWWTERRPQIVKAFDSEVYGRMPKVTPKVRWELMSTAKESVGDVAVVTKKLVGHVDHSSYPAVTVNIRLTVTTPANAKGPVPLMMEFSYDPELMAAMMKRRGITLPSAPPGPTWQEQVLAKGWGYAVLYPTDVQADNGEGLTSGIIGLVNEGQPRKPDDWGALRAWAWGASRAMDYFETDKAVNAKEVGIEGHSRYGKASLVTMAYDPRFAIGYISSSGAGGAALW